LIRQPLAESRELTRHPTPPGDRPDRRPV